MNIDVETVGRLLARDPYVAAVWAVAVDAYREQQMVLEEQPMDWRAEASAVALATVAAQKALAGVVLVSVHGTCREWSIGEHLSAAKAARIALESTCGRLNAPVGLQEWRHGKQRAAERAEPEGAMEELEVWERDGWPGPDGYVWNLSLNYRDRAGDLWAYAGGFEDDGRGMVPLLSRTDWSIVDRRLDDVIAQVGPLTPAGVSDAHR